MLWVFPWEPVGQKGRAANVGVYRGGLKYLIGRTCMLWERRSGIRLVIIIETTLEELILTEIVLGGKRESEPPSPPRCAANIQREP